ncbi:hypothetical protein SDC9_122583 [bioreactor metagenome]|uniref:Uncharacterized protein n=1 Tax=bioreactor metagenome TaxID=1076179 RepID=A0A645CF42_9ZZZZ
MNILTVKAPGILNSIHGASLKGHYLILPFDGAELCCCYNTVFRQRICIRQLNHLFVRAALCQPADGVLTPCQREHCQQKHCQ